MVSQGRSGKRRSPSDELDSWILPGLTAFAGRAAAGPAFEGGGIRCGMRADRGAVDGAAIDAESGAVEFSVIGGGRVRGLCGSGLISLADALFRAGWIDRGGRLTARVPGERRVEGKWGTAIALSTDQRVALWERDLASLIRAKAAVFAGIGHGRRSAPKLE
jgi:uncharacterized 2Fe-2S/4Fe-4S cluster protein (DUF4445 family)